MLPGRIFCVLVPCFLFHLLKAPALLCDHGLLDLKVNMTTTTNSTPSQSDPIGIVVMPVRGDSGTRQAAQAACSLLGRYMPHASLRYCCFRHTYIWTHIASQDVWKPVTILTPKWRDASPEWTQMLTEDGPAFPVGGRAENDIPKMRPEKHHQFRAYQVLIVVFLRPENVRFDRFSKKPSRWRTALSMSDTIMLDCCTVPV